MSLSAMSTELDTAFVKCLHATGDRKALGSMFCVSKYYRKLNENLLYRDVSFYAEEEGSIKRLLMTLLDRPELAKYILTFGLRGRNPTIAYPEHHRRTEQLAIDRLEYHCKIKDYVDAMPLRASTQMYIVGGIFARCGTGFKPEPSIDGILALLLLVASNIKQIDDPVPFQVRPGYFKKLENLRIKGEHVQPEVGVQQACTRIGSDRAWYLFCPLSPNTSASRRSIFDGLERFAV